MITYPNLFHLRYFVDAVDLNSISLAAKKNLVSHPAISRAINSLENHLGLELLEHKKKSFSVTKAGFEIAEQARALLVFADNFYSKNLPTEEEGTLLIGISRSLSEIYLAPLLKKISAEFPKLQIQVKFGTTSEIIEAIAKNTLNLGITIGLNKLPTVTSRSIRTGEFVLVSSKDARASSTESFIMTEPRIETESLKQQYSRHFKKDLNLAYEVGSWSVISELVENGLGIGLIPDFMLNSKRHSNCKQVKAKWFECQYEVFLHSSNRSAQKRFTRRAIEIAEEI